MKIILDNTHSKIEGLDDKLLNQIDEALSVKQDGYYFSPAYKSGFWDGKIRFFDKRSNSFPTGLLTTVIKVLGDSVTIEDVRKLREVEIEDEIQLYDDGGTITLRDYQHDAVKSALNKRRGIVNVATNGGKTEIASGIIKQLLPQLRGSETILFVTHSKEIFNQSAARIEKRLNIKVGKLGDGAWDIKPVTVVMIPTVSKYINKPTEKTISYTGEMKALKLIVDLLNGEVAKGLNNRQTLLNAHSVVEEKAESDEDKRHTTEEMAAEILSEIIGRNKTSDQCLGAYENIKKELKKYQDKKIKEAMKKHEEVLRFLESAMCFIGDEAHHSSSTTWYDTLMLCKNAVYRFGLTGTVDHKDEVNVLRLFGCMGDIITKITNDFLINKGFSAKPTILLTTVSQPAVDKSATWQQAYAAGVVENEYRNGVIADQVQERYENGDGCLVIVNHIKHGETLKKLLEDRDVDCEFTHGGFDGRERVLTDMKTGKLKVLIATSILDEGVDISGINSLWLASGGKSYRQVLQRVGRGLRRKDDGSGLKVYDYLDYTSMHLTAHSLERYRYYKGERFEVLRHDS